MLATADSYYSGGVYFERMVVDCTVLPLAESIFDAVFCKELAHHVEDLPELFIEFHRVLKADGTLVLIEPTAPRRPGMRSMPDVGREAGLTHQDYSVKDYLSALRIAGFHVSRLRHHRRLINKKYPILRCMDVLSTRALGLNRWNGLNFAKRLRAWLLGGEVVLLARRNELTLPYAGYRSVVELSAERLDAAHAEIAAMRSQETAFLPLLEQIQIEKGLDNWIPEV
jgi:SAM-dependent methyltransferase